MKTYLVIFHAYVSGVYQPQQMSFRSDPAYVNEKAMAVMQRVCDEGYGPAMGWKIYQQIVG